MLSPPAAGQPPHHRRAPVHQGPQRHQPGPLPAGGPAPGARLGAPGPGPGRRLQPERLRALPGRDPELPPGRGPPRRARRGAGVRRLLGEPGLRETGAAPGVPGRVAAQHGQAERLLSAAPGT